MLPKPYVLENVKTRAFSKYCLCLDELTKIRIIIGDRLETFRKPMMGDMPHRMGHVGLY